MRIRHLLPVFCLSFSLLWACASGPQVITPGPKPSVSGAVATPPPIPEFPPQTLPTANPASNHLYERGGLADGGPMMTAPMAPAPASGGSGAADYASGASESSSGAPLSTTRPAPMPPIDFPGPDPQVQPQPGLLTAGAWSDLDNWSFWLGLLNDQEWSQTIGVWGWDTRQRLTVTVQGPNGPLADVPVNLKSGSQTLFQARTNNQGQAELFAGLLRAAPQGSWRVEAALGQDTLSAEVDPAQLADVTLRSEIDLEPTVSADMMLMVDTTGSMGDELNYLKRELQNVAGRIAELSRSDLRLRLSANFYRDLSDEYIVRPFPFTEDAATVSQQLSAQSAGGGGDFPEAVDVALANAVDEHQWSPTARARLLFLVLDAPPHQDKEVLERLTTSLTRAAAKGIRIIPIASSGIDKETEFVLRMLAIVSGGQYVFLTDDSGVGNSHLKPTIGKFDVEKLNDLMVRIARQYIGDSPERQQRQSASPTPSAQASAEPTSEPTVEPSLEPTPEPTVEPSLEPTPEPSAPFDPPIEIMG